MKNDHFLYSHSATKYLKKILETLDEQSTEEFINTEAKKLPPKVDQERLNMKDQLFYNEDLQSNRFIFDLKSKNIFQVIIFIQLL